MDHCKVLGQREFYSETRIWGKSNQEDMERWNWLWDAKAPHAQVTKDLRGTSSSLSQTPQVLPSDTSGPAYLGLVLSNSENWSWTPNLDHPWGRLDLHEKAYKRRIRCKGFPRGKSWEVTGRWQWLCHLGTIKASFWHHFWPRPWSPFLEIWRQGVSGLPSPLPTSQALLWVS